MQRHWKWVVFCGGGMLALVMGLRQTFGFFLEPVTEGLKIGREPFSFAIALMNLFWGLASPFAGALSDRFGAARVTVLGGLFYAAGLWLMSNSGEATQLTVAGVLIGFGLSGAGFTVVLGAVGRAAPPERRAQALALTTAGGSFGQFIAIPYVQTLLSNFDWVMSLHIMVGTALLIIPLSWGKVGNRAQMTSKSSQTLGDAYREASRHRGFWLLTVGFFVCGFHLAFIGVHLPAYIGDTGFQPWLASTGLMLIGFFNIAGTYVFGSMGGRYLKKNVLAILYLGRSVIFLLFILIPISETSVLIFSASIGLLWLGTVPLTSGLVAHFFGPAYMSMLYGFVFFSHQVGSFSGAWLAGYLYDLFGSYELMWWLNVLLGLVAVLLHWPIDERPVARLEVRPT